MPFGLVFPSRGRLSWTAVLLIAFLLDKTWSLVNLCVMKNAVFIKSPFPVCLIRFCCWIRHYTAVFGGFCWTNPIQSPSLMIIVCLLSYSHIIFCYCSFIRLSVEALQTTSSSGGVLWGRGVLDGFLFWRTFFLQLNIHGQVWFHWPTSIWKYIL